MEPGQFSPVLHRGLHCSRRFTLHRGGTGSRTLEAGGWEVRPYCLMVKFCVTRACNNRTAATSGPFISNICLPPRAATRLSSIEHRQRCGVRKATDPFRVAHVPAPIQSKPSTDSSEEHSSRGHCLGHSLPPDCCSSTKHVFFYGFIQAAFRAEFGFLKNAGGPEGV